MILPINFKEIPKILILSYKLNIPIYIKILSITKN